MMAGAEHETIVIARKIRYDLTALQAKVTDLLNELGKLDLPDPDALDCPRCGLPTRGPLSLAEHLYVSHEGPVPDHWRRIEARSLEPVDSDG